MQFLFVRSPSDIPEGVQVLGIEIPGNRHDLLARCTVGNIDPQHGGSDATGDCAAKDAGFVMAADPAEGDTDLPRRLALRRAITDAGDAMVMVTPRVDLDAVAAMAVIAYNNDIHQMPDTAFWRYKARIDAIDRADSFASGAWPGPRPLPTPEAPWPQVGGAGEVEALAAPNWICGWATPAGGNRLTLDQAVAVVGHWLLYGDPNFLTFNPGPDSFDIAAAESTHGHGAAKLLEFARREATAARVAVTEAVHEGRLPMRVYTRAIMDAGMVGYSLPEWQHLTGDGGLIVYTDASQSALPTDSSAGIAYCLAPVSVIRTREGRYSIAAFDDGRVDFGRLKTTMNELEPGWGGPARMCSSPMGHASALTPEQIIETLGRYLL